MLTFLTIDEIKEMEKWDDSRINEKKEILARELTTLVHGKEQAEKAESMAKSLFSGNGENMEMPTTELDLSVLTDGKIGIADLMTICKLTASKGEAKRLIEQGGVSVNGEKVTRFDATVTADELKKGVSIKKGKKVFHKAILK